NVEELAGVTKDAILLPLDVTKEEEIAAAVDTVKAQLGSLDFLVHAVAFAKREELDGRFVDTSRDGYLLAQNVSSYSLTALARAFAPLMEGRNGSIITLSYLGGERVVANYNVMGVAKAALEMSVRYLAADLGVGRGLIAVVGACLGAAAPAAAQQSPPPTAPRAPAAPHEKLAEDDNMHVRAEVQERVGKGHYRFRGLVDVVIRDMRLQAN